jgi:hypothetical protein
LGTYLELQQDIYSLAFVCQMTDKFMDPHFDILTGHCHTNHDSSDSDDSDHHKQTESHSINHEMQEPPA